MSQELDPAVGDRRLLLRHLLQDLRDRGIPVELPVGCSDFDDWLLDALSVPKLLRQVQLKARLDLINLCTPGENLTPTVIRHRTAFDVALDPSKLKFESASSGPNRALPTLDLPNFPSTLDDQSLREIAFQLFLRSCGSGASQDVVQSLREQLEISTGRGKELAGVVSLAAASGIPSLATPDAYVALLRLVRPTAFQSFRGYVQWRTGTAGVVLASMQHAVETSWVTKNGEKGPPAARRLLATLKGSLRRMDVREADDYDEAEHAECAAAVAAAAAGLAAHCRPPLTLPWGLRAQLAEVLLRGIFDSLDESAVVPEAQQLLGLLQREVWPQLGVSPAMHQALLTWAYYRQYTASNEVQLLESAAGMAQRIGSIAGSGGGDGLTPDAAFASQVLASLGAQAVASLSDYHGAMKNVRQLKAMLALLEAVEAARGQSQGVPALLEQCIDASLGAAFGRKAAEIGENVPVEEDRVALLATETAEMLKAECAEYTPVLAARLPGARAVAAATLHRLFGARLLPWLLSVTTLTKSVLATVRATLTLEDELLRETGKVDKKVESWGIMARVAPLLYTWAQGQLAMLQGWVGRILEGENWTAATQHRGAAGRSAVEVSKAAGDVLETLFDMDLAVPPGVVRCLVEGVDGVLQRYCEAAVREVGSADSLVPPAPPLTRYKKDIADQAELAEMHASVSGSGPSEVSRSKFASVATRVKNVTMSTPSIPPITPEEQARILDVPYDSIAIRANSLHRLMQSLGGLERLVTERWDAGRSASSRAASGDNAFDWVAGMFNGTKAAATNAADGLLHFIAIKLVCGDLRGAIFEQLYRFHVELHRLQPVLEEVDAALGTLCETLHEELAPRLAGHICKTLAAALAHVLLDGGPYRLFTLHDVPLLQADLALMQAMFYAGGAGLDHEVVERLCQPAAEAVLAMSQDTGTLVANLTRAKSQPLGATARGKGVIHPDVMLRVLCHRADHAASKYLKKEYKINKKLPNAVVSSVSRSFNAVLGGSSSGQLQGAGSGMRRIAAVTP